MSAGPLHRPSPPSAATRQGAAGARQGARRQAGSTEHEHGAWSRRRRRCQFAVPAPCSPAPRDDVPACSLPHHSPGARWRADVAGRLQLLAAVEEAGGRFVLDATESGERTLPAPVDAGRLQADPRDELVRIYFDCIPDVFQRPNDRLYAWLRADVAQRGVRGILMRRHVWCDHWHGELPRLREELAVPLLDWDGAGNDPRPGPAPSGAWKPSWRCCDERGQSPSPPGEGQRVRALPGNVRQEVAIDWLPHPGPLPEGEGTSLPTALPERERGPPHGRSPSTSGTGVMQSCGPAGYATGLRRAAPPPRCRRQLPPVEAPHGQLPRRPPPLEFPVLRRAAAPPGPKGRANGSSAR